MQLNEVCEFIIDCPHSTAVDEGEGYPLIRTPNIGKGRLLLDGVHRVSEQIYLDRNARGTPQDGDLIFAREAPAGNVAVIKNGEKVCLGQRTVLIRPNPQKANPIYLAYYLLQPEQQYKLVGRANGSTVAHVNLPTIRNLKINLPDLNTQNQIANILSAYDDLQECNIQKITILELLLEQLYKKWFIRFQFDGYETTKFKNGIPEDWKEIKFSEILSFERGISYSSEEIDCDEGLNLINLKNIDAFGGFRRDGTKKYDDKYKETQVVEKGDLVIGVTDMTQDRRTVGAVALIPTIEGTSVISADLVKVVSDIPCVYLYCLCRYGFYSKYFSQFANGANVLHLKPGALLNKKVLLPTKELIDLFVGKASTIIELIDELNLANDNLIKQHDLLLPRLMSGKLEV